MLPAGALGEMTEDLHASFFEVMNVLSGLFSTRGDRSVIGEIHEAKGAPKEIRRRLRRPTANLTVEVTIDGYGKGILRLAT